MFVQMCKTYFKTSVKSSFVEQIIIYTPSLSFAAGVSHNLRFIGYPGSLPLSLIELHRRQALERMPQKIKEGGNKQPSDVSRWYFNHQVLLIIYRSGSIKTNESKLKFTVKCQA
jgi:hypothetical protein